MYPQSKNHSKLCYKLTVELCHFDTDHVTVRQRIALPHTIRACNATHHLKCRVNLMHASLTTHHYIQMKPLRQQTGMEADLQFSINLLLCYKGFGFPKNKGNLSSNSWFFWLFHHTTDVVNWMWLLQVIDDLTITVALWPTAMTSQFRRLSLSTILLINLFHFLLLLMAYSSWALPRPVSTIDLSSTEWLPSSMPIFGGFRSTSLARC